MRGELAKEQLGCAIVSRERQRGERVDDSQRGAEEWARGREAVGRCDKGKGGGRDKG